MQPSPSPLHLFDSIILERGVRLHKLQGGDWTYSNASIRGHLSTPDVAIAELRLRPVVASQHWKPNHVHFVLPAERGRLLSMYPSELQGVAGRSVLYMMEAVLYHCLALARWYSEECARHSAWQQQTTFSETRMVFGPAEPYFEFEALVTAVVRGYDALRYPIWKQWGSRGSTPNSFARSIDALETCPPDTLTRLIQERDGPYKNAKSYRHCIQHYVDVGSSSWAMFEQIKNSLWSVIVRVPDNPDARSAASWKFDASRDALTLSWEFCTNFFAAVAAVFGKPALAGANDG